MKRKAAKIVAPRQFEIVEEPIRALKECEVLLRIVSAGLCHSEMPAYHGESRINRTPEGVPYMDTDLSYPFEIGHEPSGIIEHVGPGVKDFKPGDRAGGVVRGVFATHAYADPANLIKIPETVTNLKHCLVEPLTCISNILRAANPEYGDTAVVIGSGMMGLMTLAGLQRSALRELIAVDLMESRLEWAQKMGATRVLNPEREDVLSAIKDLTCGNGVDVVIEFTGKLAGLELACDIIRPISSKAFEGRGKILIPSLYSENQLFQSSLGYKLMFKSPILHSTHPWYSSDYKEDQRRALWGYAQGIFPLPSIITHEFSLEETAKGFQTAETGADDYIKGIVVP